MKCSYQVVIDKDAEPVSGPCHSCPEGVLEPLAFDTTMALYEEMMSDYRAFDNPEVTNEEKELLLKKYPNGIFRASNEMLKSKIKYV